MSCNVAYHRLLSFHFLRSWIRTSNTIELCTIRKRFATFPTDIQSDPGLSWLRRVGRDSPDGAVTTLLPLLQLSWGIWDEATNILYNFSNYYGAPVLQDPGPTLCTIYARRVPLPHLGRVRGTRTNTSHHHIYIINIQKIRSCNQ